MDKTTYTIVCDGGSRTIATGQYFGIYPANFPGAFADNTWTQIASIAASGNIPNDWKIGDEKDIVVGGETLTVQIYDFYHDDLQFGGKAPLTFGLKNLMATKRRMEATATNANGYTGSEMYKWLRDTLFPTLPPDLQAVIKPVIKKTSVGNMSATIEAETMKIFLFSEIEYMGAISYSFAGEGIKYPIFTDTASRAKYLSNGAGEKASWWGRSPNTTTKSAFTRYSGNDTSNNLNGVCFGFCI